MITSIQHFCENGVKNLTDIFKTYTDDLILCLQVWEKLCIVKVAGMGF